MFSYCSIQFFNHEERPEPLYELSFQKIPRHKEEDSVSLLCAHNAVLPVLTLDFRYSQRPFSALKCAFPHL